MSRSLSSLKPIRADLPVRGRIYGVVALIPTGRVTTYGRVAALAGIEGQARQVGYALAALDADSELPWHRVINARGEISRRAGSGDEARQRALLEGEGVQFDGDGRVSLSRFGWPRLEAGLSRREPL